MANIKKKVLLDERALEELNTYPFQVQGAFYKAAEIISRTGKLEMPVGKKLKGYDNLFEMRIKMLGAWRGIYAYLQNDLVIILTIFKKQSQKTPTKEIDKAIRRLKEHL